MRAFFITTFACIGAISCKRSTANLNAQPRVTYSVAGEKLPIKWAVAGAMNVQCKLQAPEEVVTELDFAWAKANTLLETPLDMLLNNGSGEFLLDSVNLVLSSERVLVFDGCIGSKPEVAEQPPSGNYTAPATFTSTNAANSISSSCENLSDVILDLKRPEKIKQPTTNCGNPALAAGFAMRSTARDIKLTAYFKHKGFAGVYEMPEFELNTIELNGSANASVSSFGSALLPLPGPIKMAATTVLERLGSGALSVQVGQAKTVIPDASPRQVTFRSTSDATRISKLSETIARKILQPACRDAAIKLGTFSPDKCKIREFSSHLSTAEALEQYRSMTVVNCESRGFEQLGVKYLYALAHKPNTQAGELDFLSHTGAKPSQLSVYHKESGPVGTYEHKGWTTYIGPAADPSKCGTFDNSKQRCIVVESGSAPDGGGICGNKVNRKLSLLSVAKIN